MFFRFFFALCLVALFAIAITAETEKTSKTSDVAADVSSLEARSIQGKVVAKILGKIAAGMAAGCVLEAGEHCRHHWKNPKAAIKCGKAFFRANKGRCAAGK